MISNNRNRNNNSRILNQIENLAVRLRQLKEMKELDSSISPGDNILLIEAKGVYSNWKNKLSLINHYQTNGKDVCLLNAIEIALDYLRQKSQLTFRSGRRSYSNAATLAEGTGFGCFFASAAGYFSNRGIQKQKDRLAQIDAFVNLLEKKYPRSLNIFRK